MLKVVSSEEWEFAGVVQGNQKTLLVGLGYEPRRTI